MKEENKIDLLFLAAGFATRLEPLTLNQPKQLLKTKSGLFVDPLISQLTKTNTHFSKKVLVTNKRYFKKFSSWQAETSLKLQVLDDGVLEKNDKIGAIGDLLFAIKKAKLQNDLLVLAMDFIFEEFDFDRFINFAYKNKSSAIVVRREDDIKKLKAGSCVKVNKNHQVTQFEEKPQKPFSDLYGVPYYFIKKDDLPRLFEIPKNLYDNCGQIANKICLSSKLFAYRIDKDYLHMTTEEDYNRIKNK